MNKEIKENNRMERTRDLFKKIGDIKGTFHARMGTIKDRNSKDLRREAIGKGERERHIQLNAEFQRRARRDKKAFINEQCQKIEKNNRMGKTRDLFKKIGDIKGTFPTGMGMIKDRNSKDLAEEIKKRWKNTQKNYTIKFLMTQITMMVWSLT